MKNILKLLTAALIMAGCSKGFLEEQPSSKIFTPEKVADFQRLLDNFDMIGHTSVLPQLSADEYYMVSESSWLSSRTAVERNSYIWEEDVYGGEVDIDEWNIPYRTVFYANSIISQIDRAGGPDGGDGGLRDVYGQALFHRARANYDLLKNYSVPYDESTASRDLGIPLRKDPSVDYNLPRSTVEECYDLIFDDLVRSIDLLASTGPIPQRNRATKLASYAMLSRICLYRREYGLAEKWADEFLKRYDVLIDYNTLSSTSVAPFTRTNDELIMFGISTKYNNASSYSSARTFFVDTALIDLYDRDDLRRSVYFFERDPGRYVMKTGYNGIALVPFTGMAVDEVVLNRAECQARGNRLDQAAQSMNRLLEKRYREGTYEPVTYQDREVALVHILQERRKELVWRCLRWDDIKRLNKEGANITLKRVLGGREFILPPNSPRYVFNIPQDEINRSGIEQNKR